MLKKFLESKWGYYLRVGGATIGGLVAIWGVTSAIAEQVINDRVKAAVAEDLDKLQKEGRANNIAIQKLRAENQGVSKQLERTQDQLDRLIGLMFKTNSALNRLERPQE